MINLISPFVLPGTFQRISASLKEVFAPVITQTPATQLSKNFLRQVKKNRQMHFQLRKECMPHQLGQVELKGSLDTTYLAFMADHRFVQYNAFYERNGTWSISLDGERLQLAFDRQDIPYPASFDFYPSFEFRALNQKEMTLAYHQDEGTIERVYERI
ncbi:MAG: hypothetical protein AAFR61_13600 [Bacteroidota bacterium]